MDQRFFDPVDDGLNSNESPTRKSPLSLMPFKEQLMKKLVVLAALCAGTALFAAPESASADHRSHGGGNGYGSSYGGGRYGTYGSRYGSRSTHRSYGYSYGHRYIDPYHGERLRHRAYHHYDVILGSGGVRFHYHRCLR